MREEAVASNADGVARSVCIVLIHGIGDVGTGAVIQSAEAGIRRTLRGEVKLVDRKVSPPVGPSAGVGHAHIEALRLLWRDVGIEIIEFNWTGVAGKMRMLRPLQALWRLMETVREAPSLALHARSSMSARGSVALIGWLQWLMVGIVAVVIAGSILEVLLMPKILVCELKHLSTGSLAACDPRAETAQMGPKIVPFTKLTLTPGYDSLLWRAGYYMSASLGTLFAVGVGWAVLVFFIATPLFVAALIRVLLRRRSPWLVLVMPRTILAGAVLVAVMSFLALMLHVGVTISIAIIYSDMLAGDFDFLYLGVYLLFTGIILVFLRVALSLANLLRDVIHYLSASPGGRRRRDGDEMRHQLSLLLAEVLRRPETPRVVLVSHSLGTVILLDLLLNEQNSLAGASGATLDIVTAGSPVRRLINRLLPHRLPGPADMIQRLRQGPGLRIERWFNVYRICDYVGQALCWSALPRHLVPRREPSAQLQPGIREYLLQPPHRWPYGHANYWRDSRFVAYVATEVVRPLIVSEASVRASDG